ncbi:hypothetical protein IE4872_PD01934 (plasmid) [Rhizobium gallicum]|uniref:Uncharacterized protein n=1 Tax=Rhizobium gallicum TaxID=56730 RepID=A0A1L5NX49_9HYPH|nr:hypothetical protein IE4872_PD01934 [Rhizobium gallicum]
MDSSAHAVGAGCANTRQFLEVILLKTAFGLSLFIMLFTTTFFEQLPKELPKRNLLNPKRSST